MYRRAAVAGPANPLVIIIVAVGLVVVALVSVAVQAGAATTPTPAPNGVRVERDLGHLHAAAYTSQVWEQTVTFLGQELGSPKP